MKEMKKYIGIVKVVHESMAGCFIEFMSRYSDDKAAIEKWFELYPGSEKLFFENNPKLDSFFAEFKDFTPMTEQEKEEEKRILQILKKMREMPINWKIRLIEMSALFLYIVDIRNHGKPFLYYKL